MAGAGLIGWPEDASDTNSDPHLRTAVLFGMIKKFREYSFLLLRYHCECSQSGRG